MRAGHVALSLPPALPLFFVFHFRFFYKDETVAHGTVHASLFPRSREWAHAPRMHAGPGRCTDGCRGPTLCTDPHPPAHSPWTQVLSPSELWGSCSNKELCVLARVCRRPFRRLLSFLWDGFPKVEFLDQKEGAGLHLINVTRFLSPKSVAFPPSVTTCSRELRVIYDHGAASGCLRQGRHRSGSLVRQGPGECRMGE